MAKKNLINNELNKTNSRPEEIENNDSSKSVEEIIKEVQGLKTKTNTFLVELSYDERRAQNKFRADLTFVPNGHYITFGGKNFKEALQEAKKFVIRMNSKQVNA